MKNLPEFSEFTPPTPDEISTAIEVIKNGAASPEGFSEAHRKRIADLIGGMAGHISKLESALYEAKENLYIDSRTELLNSRGFEAKFADWLQETAENEDRRIALIFVDMDGLKKLNDKHSHEWGDIAIKHLAGALRATARKDDIVARLNGAGDEFVLALPEGRAVSVDGDLKYEPAKLDIADYVKDLPGRIMAKLEAESLLTDTDVDISFDQQLVEQLRNIKFSYGGAVFDNEDLKRPLAELLDVVDKKMYAQKALKRSSKGEPVDSAEYHI